MSGLINAGLFKALSSLLIVVIAIAVGYAILVTTGLLSAVLLLAAGLVFLYALGKISKDFIKYHPYMLIVPLVMAAFGYLSDHIPRMASLDVNNGTIIQVDGRFIAFVVVFALITTAVVTAVVARTHKKKRRKL